MIGQHESLTVTVPLALEILSRDICTETALYPCDLLCAVLRPGAEFWRTNPALHRKLTALLILQRDVLAALDDPPKEVRALR